MNNRAHAVEFALRQISSFFQCNKDLWATSFRAAKRHRVYLSFVRQANGWHCRFHHDDLAKTLISRIFIFRDAAKIYEAARRGHALKTVRSFPALDRAIAVGGGGIWLNLTKDQYLQLTESK